MTTGADRLCDTLLANGVDVCFANPGTSEMHFVAALDRKPEMRCVLGLFEGVVTGAADGYGRMKGTPAATLLHTGPGLANGLANLHNARRARAPVVNVVGDHAVYHLKYDAPLTSDIESLARPMSAWVGRAENADAIGAMTEAAFVAAVANSSVSTLILPADSAWSDAVDAPIQPAAIPARERVAEHHIRDVAAAIQRHRGHFAIVVAGDAATDEGLAHAGRIAAAFGGRVLSEVIPSRVSLGRGRFPVQRIPYFIEAATVFLKDIDLLVLAGPPEPVAFFAYPGTPSRLVHPDATVLALAEWTEDLVHAVSSLADELRAPPLALTAPPALEPVPEGSLTEDAVAVILARNLPENAIVADEGLTSARRLFALGRSAPPHDFLMTSGGAIGCGLPMALGTAIACPDRKVVNLQADGSGMYTLQALWTMARENADVLVVILNNGRYAILEIEMANLGVNEIGRNASRMMRLDQPAIDWVLLANGMGVEAARVDSCTGFDDLVRSGMRRRGPFLIEAMI